MESYLELFDRLRKQSDVVSEQQRLEDGLENLVGRGNLVPWKAEALLPLT